MKAYLITTGTIFALLALAHILRTIAEWPRMATDPWFILEGPGIGVAAAAVCFGRGGYFDARRIRETTEQPT